MPGVNVTVNWPSPCMVPAGCATVAALALHACVDFSLRIPANAVLLTVTLAIAQRCAHLPPQDIRYGD